MNPSDDREAFEILLVEDNPTDAELTINALHEGNIANRLTWVKDGAAALDFIFGPDRKAETIHRPRVILLDLRLPKVDGLEVLSALKADERTRSIPVVILTSSQEDRDITRSYDLGVNSFVSKPVEFDEFFKVVLQLGLYWLLVNRSPAEEH